MKKQKKTKSLFREAKNLVVLFFKPYGVKDKMLGVPENIKRLGLKLGLYNLFMTMVSLGFSFMLKGTNMLIEQKFIILGIILFALYRAQYVIREGSDLLIDGQEKKYNLIFQNEILLRGSEIFEHTNGKVMHYDLKTNLYKVLEKENVLNPIKRYLDTFWTTKVRHKFDIIELISVVAMLAVAIITNTAIPQYIFIPLILFFVVLSFLSTAYLTLKRNDYQEVGREVEDKKSIIVNDILRVPAIVKNDFSMRINRFKQCTHEDSENTNSFHKKMSASRLLVSALEVFAQWGFIAFYLFSINWNSISVGTIAEIAASLAIVETALNYVSRIADTMSHHRNSLIVMEKEESTIQDILKVYHNESEKPCQKPVNSISIPSFSMQYPKATENDVPFELSSAEEINISSGEIVILYGPSGSGKSTFEKMLMGRISVIKNTEVPQTSRFLFYDETLQFGSLSIYDELFCDEVSPSLEKMQEILENLHLWCEIQNNCVDVWEWLKAKTYSNSLSNGQKQRLILAKMLYWMDSDIDVLVLDEATSGLDDKVETDNADAEKILEYIVRCANKDKKRIVIISTHQNIDGFISNLSSEFTFKSFVFEKEGDKNVIKEV